MFSTAGKQQSISSRQVTVDERLFPTPWMSKMAHHCSPRSQQASAKSHCSIYLYDLIYFLASTQISPSELLSLDTNSFA